MERRSRPAKGPGVCTQPASHGEALDTSGSLIKNLHRSIMGLSPYSSCGILAHMRKGRPAIERLYLYARLDEVTGCLVWTGSLDRWGYGRFHWNGKEHPAHRAAWKLHTGQELEPDVCVLHHCDNRACIRIEHLFLGSHADNVKDKASKGRSGIGRGQLPYGVERVGKRYRARLRCRPGRSQVHIGMYDTAEEAAKAAWEAREQWLRDV